MGGVVGRGVYNLEGESEDNIYFLLSEYLYFWKNDILFIHWQKKTKNKNHFKKYAPPTFQNFLTDWVDMT